MANPQHVNIVLKGRKALALWRRKYPEQRLELEGADLSHCDLRAANFRNANLIGADFRHSDLIAAVFTDADLTRANLADADLRRSQLTGSTLFRAVLDRVDLTGASASQAKLGGCLLREANLTDVDLSRADLSHADLGQARLTRTNLTGAVVSKTNFAEAHFNRLILADLDLTFAQGLAAVRHVAPSSLGVDTLSRSVSGLPWDFVRGCGVPEALIQAMLANTDALACPARFLCHAQEDREVVQRIYDGCQRRGVRCWLDDRGPVPDDAAHDRFIAQLRPGDQVVLCMSQAALSSLWVDAAVDAIVTREQRFRKQTGREQFMLLPLNLDGYLLGGNWRHRHEGLVRSRLTADFSGWRRNDSKFERELAQLAGALNAAARGGRAGR